MIIREKCVRKLEGISQTIDKTSNICIISKPIKKSVIISHKWIMLLLLFFTVHFALIQGNFIWKIAIIVFVLNESLVKWKNRWCHETSSLCTPRQKSPKLANKNAAKTLKLSIFFYIVLHHQTLEIFQE